MRSAIPCVLLCLFAHASTAQTYLKASNTDVDDWFGASVSMSGDTLVVGARLEDSAAAGVDGDASDDSASDTGAAYVFVRDGGSWSQQAYLKASNPDDEDQFGYSVAVSGDTLVVGAPFEDSNATGIDGDQDDDSASLAGAAYVFVRDGGTWSQQAYLKASNTETSDSFGWSVAISGDTVVVGAPFEEGGDTGVNEDESDNSTFGAGAAYVFARDGGNWSQQAYLKASNTGEADLFGRAVSICSETIVVGARNEASSAAGVDGDQGDDSMFNAGAAYVFVRDGTTWTQQAYLKASNPDAEDYFATSVAVCGDTLVAGAFLEDSAATGVDGDDANNSASGAGAAYVFSRQGAVWSQQAYLKAPTTVAGTIFGHSVSISGDAVVVGWPYGSGATVFSGAACRFRRQGSTWTHEALLEAPHADVGDEFGTSVAQDGDAVVVGAMREASSATGIGGDQTDDSAPGAGAAYVFEPDPWTDLGQALGGTSGDPLLVGSGTLLTGDPVSLSLTDALGSTTTYFVIGLAEANFPFYGGTLVPWFEAPLGLFLALPTNASGELLLTDTWPGGVPGGTELFFQHWIVDPGGPFGFAASNAVRGTVP